MADDDIRPSETGDVYAYDLLTAERQQRARTAASRYRGQENPADFDPAPAEPEPDPSAPEDGDDIRPNESSKVGYYDGLLPNHRTTTDNEVTRFAGQLSDYADYYNAHIRKSGDPEYEMPISQVTPIDVVDDEAERPNESNLVSAYDAKASGYSAISVASNGTAGEHGESYSEQLDSANERFDKLQSEDDPNGMKKTFEDLDDTYGSNYDRNDSSQTDRDNMSVTEAGHSDISQIKDDIDNKFRDAAIYGKDEDDDSITIENPGEGSVAWMDEVVQERVEEMAINISSKLITIDDYNTLQADMLGYIERGLSYNRFKQDRGDRYEKFSESMLSTYWNKIYSEYHNNG